MPAIQFKPTKGGDLVTKSSAATIGLANYTTKRNFRREYDQEVRREGDVLFRPNKDLPLDIQAYPPLPSDEEINLIYSGRSPRGTLALVIATPTTIFRYLGIDDVATYFEEPFLGATGPDAVVGNYPVFGAEVSAVQTTHQQITIKGKWTEYSPTNPNGMSLGQTIDILDGTVTTHTLTVVGISYNNAVLPQDRETTFTVAENITGLGILPGDTLIGPDTIYPVYSTDASDQWLEINPPHDPTDSQSSKYKFSKLGHRWEVENISGTLVFNNGYDLPIAYNIDDLSVEFLFELRENGYGFVDNIDETNGLLIAADVSEISTNDLEEIMNTSDITGINGQNAAIQPFLDITKSTRTQYRMIGSPVANPKRWGSIVEGSMDVGTNVLRTKFPMFSWTSGDELLIPRAGASLTYAPWAPNDTSIWGAGVTVSYGGTLYKSDNAGTGSGLAATPEAETTINWISQGTDYNQDLITTLTSGPKTVLTVDIGTAPSGVPGSHFTFFLAGVEVTLTEGVGFTGATTTTQLRDAIVTKLSTDPSPDFVELQAAYSFAGRSTDEIVITPASSGKSPGVYGIDVNVLSGAEIVRHVEYGVVDNAGATITDEIVQRNDILELGPQPFSYDLDDDSSGILRMEDVQGTLVVFKDTTIFLGRYTGDVDDPFTFRIVYRGEDTIFWRWGLVRVNGDYLVYPGRNKFFRFDVITANPVPMEKLSLCDDIFYSNVERADMERVYGSVNTITSEIWWNFPNGVTDKALCWDYKFNTCSTVDKYYSASESIESPTEGQFSGPSEHLFVMGGPDVTMYTYGRANLKRDQFAGETSMYSREGYYDIIPANWIDRVAYTPVLLSGWGIVNDEFNEKILKRYVLILSSQSDNPEVRIKLYGTLNPSKTQKLLADVQLPEPDTENSIETYFKENYYRDEILIENDFRNAGIATRIYDVDIVDSESAPRDTDA